MGNAGTSILTTELLRRLGDYGRDVKIEERSVLRCGNGFICIASSSTDGGEKFLLAAAPSLRQLPKGLQISSSRELSASWVAANAEKTPENSAVLLGIFSALRPLAPGKFSGKFIKTVSPENFFASAENSAGIPDAVPLFSPPDGRFTPGALEKLASGAVYAVWEAGMQTGYVLSSGRITDLCGTAEALKHRAALLDIDICIFSANAAESVSVEAADKAFAALPEDFAAMAEKEYAGSCFILGEGEGTVTFSKNELRCTAGALFPALKFIEAAYRRIYRQLKGTEVRIFAGDISPAGHLFLVRELRRRKIPAAEIVCTSDGGKKLHELIASDYEEYSAGRYVPEI